MAKLSPQGPHSHILMTGGPTAVHILYPKKSQLQNLSTQKNPYFFQNTQKNPSVFLHQQILLFIFWKAKTCQLQLWFWSKQNYKLRLCYFRFELIKNTISKKIPVLFSRPKKMPASFIDPKNSLLAKMSDLKKSFGPPPSLKYVSGASGV